MIIRRRHQVYNKILKLFIGVRVINQSCFPKKQGLLNYNLTEGRSCWLVLCFVWLSGFHRGTKQQGQRRPQGGLRASGQGAWIETANTLQIPQMPLYCACLFISISPCVRACPSAVMSYCVYNRRLLLPRFCMASVAWSAWLLQSPALAQCYSIS